MFSRLAKFLVLIMLVSLPLAAQARQIQNFENEAIPARLDGSQHTIAQVRDGIAAAARNRGWTVEPGTGNELIASILVRNRHYAEVSITYTTTSFSIKYRDSRDLNYNEARNTIHRNYNNWVITLSNDIKSRL